MSNAVIRPKKLQRYLCERNHSREMSRTCLLFAVAATLAGAAEQPTLPTLPSQLTLAQALNIALQNSTNIRTAMAQLEQASGQYEQLRSRLLPQLDVSAHQDYLTVNLAGLGFLVPGVTTGKIGPFASMDARVFLKQEIFNLSSIRGWQSSRSRQESSRLLVDNARDLVALQVVATYLEALKAKASRDTLMAQTKLANELYSLTRARVNQGAAAELDANRATQCPFPRPVSSIGRITAAIPQLGGLHHRYERIAA